MKPERCLYTLIWAAQENHEEILRTFVVPVVERISSRARTVRDLIESPLFVEHLRRIANEGAAEPSKRRGAAASGAARQTALTVTEMLPGPGDLWISSSEGGYASEFLVQLEGS